MQSKPLYRTGLLQSFCCYRKCIHVYTLFTYAVYRKKTKVRFSEWSNPNVMRKLYSRFKN